MAKIIKAASAKKTASAGRKPARSTPAPAKAAKPKGGRAVQGKSAAPKAAAKPARKKTAAPAKAKEPVKAVSPKSHLTAKDVEKFRDLLLSMRDRLTGQISFLANDSLRVVDDTPSDDRTDDFDREFALNLVSSEQDAVFEIDEALRRIHDGTYGVCEMSGQPIEKERLKIIPYARYCVKVQSEMERGRTRYRPFGSTIGQAAERAIEPMAAEEQEE